MHTKPFLDESCQQPLLIFRLLCHLERLRTLSLIWFWFLLSSCFLHLAPWPGSSQCNRPDGPFSLSPNIEQSCWPLLLLSTLLQSCWAPCFCIRILPPPVSSGQSHFILSHHCQCQAAHLPSSPYCPVWKPHTRFQHRGFWFLASQEGRTGQPFCVLKASFFSSGLPSLKSDG